MASVVIRPTPDKSQLILKAVILVYKECTTPYAFNVFKLFLIYLSYLKLVVAKWNTILCEQKKMGYFNTLIFCFHF